MSTPPSGKGMINRPEFMSFSAIIRFASRTPRPATAASKATEVWLKRGPREVSMLVSPRAFSHWRQFGQDGSFSWPSS